MLCRYRSRHRGCSLRAQTRPRPRLLWSEGTAASACPRGRAGRRRLPCARAPRGPLSGSSCQTGVPPLLSCRPAAGLAKESPPALRFALRICDLRRYGQTFRRLGREAYTAFVETQWCASPVPSLGPWCDPKLHHGPWWAPAHTGKLERSDAAQSKDQLAVLSSSENEVSESVF